jgi:hypothetical protein
MRRTRASSLAALFVLPFLAFLSFSGPARGHPVSDVAEAQEAAASNPPEKVALIVIIPGYLPWTDTGLDVEAGQEILFKAAGKISLQRGNPEADCGPEGYDLQTIRQPIADVNMGALIGKVVIFAAVAVDEKTGEEKKEEVAKLFVVGSENRVEMPAKGRLYLGINENVVGDNVGEFKVIVTEVTKAGR